MSHPGSNTNAAFDFTELVSAKAVLPAKALMMLLLSAERKAGLVCQGSSGSQEPRAAVLPLLHNIHLALGTSFLS